MIAAVTAGWRIDERQRHVDQRDAGLVGQVPERVGGLELGLVGGDREVVAVGDHRRAPRRQVVGALAPAPRQPAAGERAPRDDAHDVTPGRSAADRPPRRARGSNRAAARQTNLVSPRWRATHCASTTCADGVRRRADVADLALRDEVRQRAERLLVVGPRVPAVHLVEVDPVGLQAFERGFDLAHDPAPRVAGLVGVVAHRAVELRRQPDVARRPSTTPCRRSLGRSQHASA